MRWEDIMSHESRINGVLRAAHDQNGWTPVDDRTPAEIMMTQEPEWDESHDAPDGPYDYPSSDAHERIELRALKLDEALMIADWARRQQMAWIAADGPHPFRIVQRVFALLFGFYKDLLGPFNGRMLALMLGQGRAAFSATMEALFADESLRKFGLVVKVAGQKSASASQAYAANARKHKPKQQLEGKGDEEQEEALNEEQRTRLQELKKRLPELRRDAERRRMAELVGCEPGEIDLTKIRLED